MHWSEGILPVFDLETTGTDTQAARIVEVALLLVDDRGRVLPGSYHTLVDPEVEIPKEASDVHGITTERARSEGVKPIVALREIQSRLSAIEAFRWPLVIYNAPFDWSLLHAEWRRHRGGHAIEILDIPLIDPLVIDRALDKYRKGSRKLADVARHYGIALEDAHSADADSVAAAQVARALVDRYPETLRDIDLAALQALQTGWHADWRDGYNDYRVRKGQEPIRGNWPAA